MFNLSCELQNELISSETNWKYIKYVKNQDENVMLKLLEKHPKMIYFVSNMKKSYFEHMINKYPTYTYKIQFRRCRNKHFDREGFIKFYKNYKKNVLLMNEHT